MKKNLIIFVLLLTNVLFCTFAVMQKMKADAQQAWADESQLRAEQQRIIAEESRMLLQHERARLAEALQEAELQREIAQTRLVQLAKKQ